jgi:HAD superfamily hydrolase (TIGR01509 family)
MNDSHAVGLSALEPGLIKAIFWDNDGVLVDTERLYFLATQHALALVDIPFSTEQYIELFLVQGKGAFHLAAERGYSPDDIADMRKKRDVLFSELLSREKLVIEGVHSVLDSLHGRFSMGIVTSSEREHFDLIHRDTDLMRYFEFVLVSGDYARSKPHPDPYLKALELSGLRAEECLVIEDSARGLTAACAAGLQCIVVPSHLTIGSDFAGAYRVVESLKQVGELLAHG